jgi:hypothetical protein
MDNKNENNNTSPFSKNIDKALWREQTYAEIVNELNNNPEVQKMKETYLPSSVDSFIRDYASDKVKILEWGSVNEHWDEEQDIYWVNLANEGLNQIQQKKLFDLQCLWRAGNIDLEGVLISDDFTRWEMNIMNCPFIPPITQQEVELYILYLQSNNYEDRADTGLDQWQEYDEIIEAYNSDNTNRNFPEWYDFYNGRMGTGVYMTFPDKRGQLENFYLHLSHEFDSVRKLAENKKQEAPVQNTNALPWLNAYNADQLRWFVATFEDAQTQEYAGLCGAFRDLDDYNFDWDTDKMLLSSTVDPIPVLPWHNWREALHRSAEWYRRKKIMEAMPVAYESYCIRRDVGIPFEKDHYGESLGELLEQVRQKRIDEIIQGRVFNGESPDLNF